MIAGVAVARALSGMDAVLFWWRVGEVGADMRGICRARSTLESQGLDGVDDAESVSDAGYAHLFQGVVIEFEKNVASDVVLFEDVGVSAAFYVSQPFGDVCIRPGFEKVGKGSAWGWIHGKVEKAHAALGCEQCDNAIPGSMPRCKPIRYQPNTCKLVYHRQGWF